MEYEQFLQEKFGPIYNFLFEGFEPVKTLEEFKIRYDRVLYFLEENPAYVFRTGDLSLINSIDDLIKRDEKKIQQYYKAQKEWKMEKGGLMSKPALSNIFGNLTIEEADEIYKSDEKLRKVMDRAMFWEKLLEELNIKDNINYQEILNIEDVRTTVITVTVIKELIEGLNAFVKYRNVPPSKSIHEIYNKTGLELIGTDYRNIPNLFTHKLPYLIHLTTLTIHNLEDKDLNDNLFDNLGNLLYLFVYGNIKNLPTGLFRNLKNLEILGISGNDLGKITKHQGDIFSGLVNLRKLTLDSNKIKSLPSNIFRDLYNLVILDLSDNEITSLPSNIFRNLDNLSSLDLYSNKLTNLPKNLFKGLDTLSSLTLEDNNINTLPEGIFNGLDNLEDLIINETKKGKTVAELLEYSEIYPIRLNVV